MSERERCPRTTPDMPSLVYDVNSPRIDAMYNDEVIGTIVFDQNQCAWVADVEGLSCSCPSVVAASRFIAAVWDPEMVLTKPTRS
jgi:hypothetical protein